LEVPLDSFVEAFPEVCLGLPVQEATGFGDVSLGVKDIGFWERVCLDVGRLAKLLGDVGEDVFEGGWGFSAADVEDFVAFYLEGGDGASGNVFYESKVARLGAVAKELDGLPPIYPLDEAEDAHVGSTGGAIDGEIAQDSHIKAVVVVVGIGHKLGGFFGGGVGGYGGIDRLVFGEGQRRTGIERGGGS
jgi:hypothetical protein